MKLLLVTFLLSSCLQADSLMYKEDSARTGAVQDAWGAPVSLAWKFEGTSAFYSSPAIQGGKVYLGNEDHHVYCLNLSDGKEVWSTELAERIYGSSPQILQKSLVIASVDGCIDELDLGDGKILRKICDEGAPILGSPLVNGGLLYTGTDKGELEAFELSSGKKLWSYRCDSQIHDSAPVLMKGRLFVASGHRLYAFDPQSGSLIWQGPAYDKIDSTPLAYQGRLYIGTGDDALHCFDAVDGHEIWKYQTPKGIMSSPSLDSQGGRLVFGCADGEILALDLDGHFLWTSKTGKAVLASPLITGPSVWVGSFDGHFYGLKLADGKIFFDFETGSGIFSTAAEAGGMILVGSRDDVLYCFHATAP